MDRPSKEEVDRWLARVEAMPAGTVFRGSVVLAAEVRALQERAQWLETELRKYVLIADEDVQVDLALLAQGGKLFAIPSPERQISELRGSMESMAVQYEARNGDREKCWVVADELRALIKPCAACELESAPKAAAVDTSRESK